MFTMVFGKKMDSEKKKRPIKRDRDVLLAVKIVVT